MILLNDSINASNYIFLWLFIIAMCIGLLGGKIKDGFFIYISKLWASL